MQKKIELLAPAKDLTHGMAAINSGADAVYIGAPLFGARANASNSIADIDSLVKYAHQFRAKVFAAVNTIIYDSELESCRKMIFDLYNAGVDALIVQDMGILEMDLPPISLHASTQANNRSADKIQFLEKTGIKRVVLARELNLKQIKEISEATSVELEFFVSGALCVCYSGNCYLSASRGGRSANRGECAQSCRLPYNLVDCNGKTLISNTHLLSIKDLDISDQIPNLIEAGITSFKIEGRLKDLVYVKNNVSFLRKKIDAFLDGNKNYLKASSGKSFFGFEPALNRSFNRGYSHYFVNGRNAKIGSWASPKSIGQFIGKLVQTKGNAYLIENGNKLNKGDGLCFINEKNEINGIRVNNVMDDLVVPNEMKIINKGTDIYRNNDLAFSKLVEREDSAVRKINIKLVLSESESGFQLFVKDEDGFETIANCIQAKEKTKNNESVVENIKTQLCKTGNTPYVSEEIIFQFSENWFIPISKINELRRSALAQLSEIRSANYKREEFLNIKTSHPYPVTELDFTYNVANKLARKFYERHGAKKVGDAFELKSSPEKGCVMTTKYCIKYELDQCPKYHKNELQKKLNEPLLLSQGNNKYKLKFNCGDCEMELWEQNDEEE